MAVLFYEQPSSSSCCCCCVFCVHTEGCRSDAPLHDHHRRCLRVARTPTMLPRWKVRWWPPNIPESKKMANRELEHEIKEAWKGILIAVYLKCLCTTVWVSRAWLTPPPTIFFF